MLASLHTTYSDETRQYEYALDGEAMDSLFLDGLRFLNYEAAHCFGNKSLAAECGRYYIHLTQTLVEKGAFRHGFSRADLDTIHQADDKATLMDQSSRSSTEFQPTDEATTKVSYMLAELEEHAQVRLVPLEAVVEGLNASCASQYATTMFDACLAVHRGEQKLIYDEIFGKALRQAAILLSEGPQFYDHTEAAFNMTCQYIMNMANEITPARKLSPKTAPIYEAYNLEKLLEAVISTCLFNGWDINTATDYCNGLTQDFGYRHDLAQPPGFIQKTELAREMDKLIVSAIAECQKYTAIPEELLAELGTLKRQ